MRLLSTYDNGEIFITKDLVYDIIPPYAILSHTWGAYGEDVTFGDIGDGGAKKKASYSKIRLCLRQAKKDGLQFAWVDTCCIDRTSSAELSEAINLMFMWYNRAEKCYVYLSDVSSINDAIDNAERPWQSQFTSSRWFTRGWTLQELIAPKIVEFFSREGDYLGSKSTLEQQIHEITGIPIAVLRGQPLSQCSIEERMRWTKNRMTTRSEDQAYCLMGIFDVYMPVIYGEGEMAMHRLRTEISRAIEGKRDAQPSCMRPTISYVPFPVLFY